MTGSCAWCGESLVDASPRDHAECAGALRDIAEDNLQEAKVSLIQSSLVLGAYDRLRGPV